MEFSCVENVSCLFQDVQSAHIWNPFRCVSIDLKMKALFAQGLSNKEIGRSIAAA